MQIKELVPLLTVEDPARSIDFYTRAFSFHVVQDVRAEGRMVWALLRNGAAKLMINKHDGADSAPSRYRPGRGGAVLYINVDAARDVHAALTAQGIAAGDVTVQPYGMEEFHLRDPDGYEIAVGSPTIRIA